MMLPLLLISLALPQPELRPVDAGYEDASPIRESGLVPRVDQRQPIGFQQVYELVKPDGSVVYVRIAGGLYAEFDRSVYAADGGAEVPPGTVYKLGKPGAETEQVAVPAVNRVSLAVPRDTGQATRRPVSSGAGSTDAVPVGAASVIGNELYRRIRISQLLHSILKPA